MPRLGSRVRVSFSALSLKGCSNGGMVDTKDLKSFGHCGCAGSSPASSTLRDESCFSRFVSFFLSPLPVGYEYGSVVILGGLILAQSENLGDCVKILIFA